eukprot:s3687_g1.t1
MFGGYPAGAEEAEDWQQVSSSRKNRRRPNEDFGQSESFFSSSFNDSLGRAHIEQPEPFLRTTPWSGFNASAVPFQQNPQFAAARQHPEVPQRPAR